MKRSRIRIAAAAIAAAGLLLGIGAFVVISTGAYNVAATTAHTPMTRWLLNTMQERSVAVRAGDVPSPPPVDSGTLKHAYAEYDEMCVVCHGAPGVERGMLGKGMNPEPPDLAKVAAEWNDRELFWITKHGIKLAGMPAFGVTHSDKELWEIVAVVRRLQDMSAEDYRRSVAQAGAHGDTHAIKTEIGGEVQATDAPAHAHAGASRQRDVAQAPPHQEHQRVVGRTAPRQPAAEAAPTNVESTQKLKALAAELLRDPMVLEQIRADSALRRRWENPDVRKQLGTRPH